MKTFKRIAPVRDACKAVLLPDEMHAHLLSCESCNAQFIAAQSRVLVGDPNPPDEPDDSDYDDFVTSLLRL